MGLGRRHRPVEGGDLDLQGVAPLLEGGERLLRRQGGKQAEGGLELQVLLDRGRHQLGQPVGHLPQAGVGDLVDGPLGPPAGPHRLPGVDQLALLEGLHHAVQRAVVEPDALVLGPGPEGLRHLVGVHRPLLEAGQHGQGQRVGPGAAGRHGWQSTPLRLLVKEYFVCRLQSVPDVAHGPDPAGLAGIGLDLQADAADVLGHRGRVLPRL